MVQEECTALFIDWRINYCESWDNYNKQKANQSQEDNK